MCRYSADGAALGARRQVVHLLVPVLLAGVAQRAHHLDEVPAARRQAVLRPQEVRRVEVVADEVHEHEVGLEGEARCSSVATSITVL